MSKLVLLVDDNSTVRQTLRMLFEASGYDCAEAADGLEAIECARNADYDLVVLDLSMPRMSGLDAAPKLRELLPFAPIILFTLFAGAVLEQEAKAAGINIVVPKSEAATSLIGHAKTLLNCDS